MFFIQSFRAIIMLLLDLFTPHCQWNWMNSEFLRFHIHSNAQQIYSILVHFSSTVRFLNVNCEWLILLTRSSQCEMLAGKREIYNHVILIILCFYVWKRCHHKFYPRTMLSECVCVWLCLRRRYEYFCCCLPWASLLSQRFYVLIYVYFIKHAPRRFGCWRLPRHRWFAILYILLAKQQYIFQRQRHGLCEWNHIEVIGYTAPIYEFHTILEDLRHQPRCFGSKWKVNI